MAESGAPLSFFRVFDLAFFLPGGLLCATFSQTALWPYANAWPAKLESVGGLCYLVGAVGGAFVAGLFVHVIQRNLSRLKIVKKLVQGTAEEGGWYNKLSGAARGELALYFWYLRAVTLNMAVASLLVGLAATFVKGRPGAAFEAMFDSWILTDIACIAAALLFARLSADYDRALKTVSKTNMYQVQDTSATH